ncbi:transposase [Streptomyces sp. AN091965]|nr:transposase [Streptomyces sp. AN091965]
MKRSDLAGWAQYGYGASHSRFFWGLRLQLMCTLQGLPVALALTGAKADERETVLGLFAAEPHLLAARPGRTLIGDKNYFGRGFERELAEYGIQLLGPTRKGERQRPGGSLNQAVAAGHRVDQRNLQGTARPRTAPTTKGLPRPKAEGAPSVRTGVAADQARPPGARSGVGRENSRRGHQPLRSREPKRATNLVGPAHFDTTAQARLRRRGTARAGSRAGRAASRLRGPGLGGGRDRQAFQISRTHGVSSSPGSDRLTRRRRGEREALSLYRKFLIYLGKEFE